MMLLCFPFERKCAVQALIEMQMRSRASSYTIHLTLIRLNLLSDRHCSESESLRIPYAHNKIDRREATDSIGTLARVLRKAASGSVNSHVIACERRSLNLSSRLWRAKGAACRQLTNSEFKLTTLLFRLIALRDRRLLPCDLFAVMCALFD